MSTNTSFSLSNPAIRHLAWLCSSPQLLQCSLSFTPQYYLPNDYFATLLSWDAHPQNAPPLLREPPQKRLGHYVERLYRVLLESLLGWDILLQNQQIHSNGRTIGELDFVVYNRHEQRVEHHEIAIKFYLGHTQWFGPNAHDRLDLKTSSLLDQQSQRSQTPEARELLAGHGISVPLIARIFMPGYLFYPPAKVPAYVPADHLRGNWVYAHQLHPEDCATWVVLRKPHWIGPWQQSHPPCPQQAAQILEQIQQDQSPRLFAQLKHHAASGQWCEVQRWFVMPQNWPGT
ncbi:DUF1853 family protein [Marinobacter gelidimuriae]|uniref:DUF1853 family protein n=1 Tax=Marinobacter gelidimuriae TaxID=2739064 RepID=UPI000371740A|nr:DUF1853 family protein [Marinobacter gelidimuriae]